MYSTVMWHAFLRVNREDKVQKVLNQLEQLFGTTLLGVQFKRYWKESTLFDVGFETKTEPKTVEEAVFHALLMGNKLGGDWHVVGPNPASSGLWHFEAINPKPSNPAIHWIQYNVYSDDEVFETVNEEDFQ